MNRYTRLVLAAGIALLATARLQAADIFWLGGTGTLLSPNYSDGTNTGLTPQPGDVVNFGNGGTATYSDSGFAVGKLRVGHSLTTPSPGGAGQGTVTINSGALVELTAGAMGADNAALWVGNVQNGTLNLEGGATLSLNRLAVIGIGSNVNRSGTLNIKTGGILNVNDGNLTLSDRNGSSGNGVQGIVNISDPDSKLNILGPGADLVLSNRQATATYTQTDGTVMINDTIDLAPQSGSSTGTSLTISGGSITTGTSNGATAGNFFVGRGSSTNATVNISGTAVVNVGNRLLLGGTDGATTPTAIAKGVVVNHSGGTLNTDLDVRVADTFISPTSDATYNLSGTGVINSTTGGVIARQGTGKFIQTGGTANFNGALSIGNRETATTTTANGLYKISAGAMNVLTSLSVAPKGVGELRVVGDDGTITVTGDFSVNNTVDGLGKLAFEFETGDLLSQISVTGAATFASGASLAFDTSNASPTQTTYNLLTAASIVDSGLVGPAGWTIKISEGGNGKILQAIQSVAPSLPGDFNNDGKVDAGDYATWRKNDTANATLPNDNSVGNQAARYTLWRSSFGNPPGAGSSLNAAQVPEPASLMLVLVGAAALAGMRRR